MSIAALDESPLISRRSAFVANTASAPTRKHTDGLCTPAVTAVSNRLLALTAQTTSTRELEMKKSKPHEAIMFLDNNAPGLRMAAAMSQMFASAATGTPPQSFMERNTTFNGKPEWLTRPRWSHAWDEISINLAKYCGPRISEPEEYLRWLIGHIPDARIRYRNNIADKLYFAIKIYDPYLAVAHRIEWE